MGSEILETNTPIFKGRNSNAKRVSGDGINSWSLSALTAGASLTGKAEGIELYPNVGVAVKTDQPGTLYMEQSPDGVNWDITRDYQVSANVSFQKILFVSHRFYRTRFISSASVDHTYFRLQTSYGTYAETGAGAGSGLSDLKRLCWDTDVDWNSGTVPGTLQVIGVGSAALLRTADLADFDDDFDFSVPGQWTPSDGGSEIEVAGGQVALVETTSINQNYPFTTDSNYDFDSGEIEVTGGVAKIIRGLDNVRSIDLDGSNEYIEVPDEDSLSPSPEFSVAFWCKPDVDALMYMVSKFGVAGNRSFGIRRNAGTGYVAVIYSATGVATDTTTGSTGLTTGSWHHVVISFDGNAGTMDIYVNGSVDINDTTLLGGISNEDENLLIGALGPDSGPSNYWNGHLDQIAIYNKALDSSEVSAIYNSGTPPNLLTLSTAGNLQHWWTFDDPDDDATGGTGEIHDVVGGADGIPRNTESGDLVADAQAGVTNPVDPVISNTTGLVFASPLGTFTETVTKPENTDVRYHVSSDDGTTWEYWNGAAWVTSDESFAQSNTAADINANIDTLAGSGTFKFQAVLRSTSVFTPEIDNINVTDAPAYQTTDDLHVTSENTSQLNASGIVAWLTAAITNSQPANTDIRVLFSVDGRSTWLTWNGSSWAAPSSATTRTDATSVSDAVTNFASLPIGSSTLDLRVFLKTDDSTETPTVSNVNVVGDNGLSTGGVYETDEFDSGVFDNDWDEVTFVTSLGSGGSITIKAKAANTSAALAAAAYGAALSNGVDAGVVGQLIQFEITIVGDGAEHTGISKLCCDYEDPVREIVSP